MPKPTKSIREAASGSASATEVHLNVKMSPELRKELRKRALDEGIPLKDFLSRLLWRHLDRGATSR